MTGAWRRLARSLVLGGLLVPVAAGTALAHPLGNFTINHYAGVRVEPSRVLLDVVIDEAEIPAFQAIQVLDRDGDGLLSPDERDSARAGECQGVAGTLELTVGGSAATPRLVEAGIAFPAGNAGLKTMRLVCTFEAALAAPITTATEITFLDGFEASRIGWREITVAGSGVTAGASGIPRESVSARLTSYPLGLAAAPEMRSVSFTASPGGALLAPFEVPDAQPVGMTVVGAGQRGVAPEASGVAPGASGVTSEAAGVTPEAAAVPGGDTSIPDVLRTAPATPIVSLFALLTAAMLGAGHALTPGHGKTLMAAYLVGTRGTLRHAVGLGLAVSVSHTLGILGLAAVVLAAESTFPPDQVVRIAPLVAAVSIVLIGGWMLVTEGRRALARRREAQHVEEARHAHDAHHAYDAQHAHDHAHGLQVDPAEHAHGGVRHSHVPPAGSSISWRSLFVLGLAGGLVPSASALLVLLATIAAGRPAWGVVLVAAFGLGMAAVMTGVGLAFVHARGLLDRAPSRLSMARAARLVPAGAAVLVLAVGIVLTSQALAVAALG